MGSTIKYYVKLHQTYDFKNSKIFLKAFPLWDTAFFSSSESSAIVLPEPSTINIGS